MHVCTLCQGRPIWPGWRTRIFVHSWRGGDPTILYNITAYGLYSLFVEIQTKARFPINFKWEISEAWVRMGTMGTIYTSKILVAKKGLDFFPEITSSGRHKLMQYNRVRSSGLNCRETAKMSISH